MQKKETFVSFLQKQFPSNYNKLLASFEMYYEWLVEENKKINLFSRKMDLQDIWTTHFLDSLLPVQYISFSGCTILDFGTGGGFPGIPAAICFPDSRITLLDSKKKKIQALRSAAAHLHITNCSFIDLRLEELSKNLYGSFDLILCRSVRIMPEFKSILLNLLTPEGKLVLYKSQNLDDTKVFGHVQIYDVSTPTIGVRRIVVVKK